MSIFVSVSVHAHKLLSWQDMKGVHKIYADTNANSAADTDADKY